MTNKNKCAPVPFGIVSGKFRGDVNGKAFFEVESCSGKLLPKGTMLYTEFPDVIEALDGGNPEEIRDLMLKHGFFEAEWMHSAGPVSSANKGWLCRLMDVVFNRTRAAPVGEAAASQLPAVCNSKTPESEAQGPLCRNGEARPCEVCTGLVAGRAAFVLDEVPDSVLEATADAIGDAYDCARVWSAWMVYTMGSDDFHPVAESPERVAEIARAAIVAWEASKKEQVNSND